MKKVLAAIVLFAMLAYPAGGFAAAEKINVNYALTYPQLVPVVCRYANLPTVVVISGQIRTPNNVATATYGFRGRMIFPEVEEEFESFGLVLGYEAFLKKPEYSTWWRESNVAVGFGEKRSGIFEYYLWTECHDSEGSACRFAGKPVRLAVIGDPDLLPLAISRDLQAWSWRECLCLRADMSSLGLPYASYDEKEMGKGYYLYFDIYADGTPQISYNAGRIGYGWKMHEVRIPRQEFEEKDLVGKELTVKVRITPAREEKPISLFGFAEKKVLMPDLK